MKERAEKETPDSDFHMYFVELWQAKTKQGKPSQGKPKASKSKQKQAKASKGKPRQAKAKPSPRQAKASQEMGRQGTSNSVCGWAYGRMGE